MHRSTPRASEQYSCLALRVAQGGLRAGMRKAAPIGRLGAKRSVPTLQTELARRSVLTREHVGDDGAHDVGLVVDDHEVLPPHEVREVRVCDLADKVVR